MAKTLCTICTPCVHSWQQYPPCRSMLHPSWVCDPEEERYMPSTYSVLHVHHSDSSACTALHAQHSATHSTTCTVSCHAQRYAHSITCSALLEQHHMHRTICTALYAQHYMHSPAWTALHAQRCLDSTTCTALHWCWCVMCSAATLHAAVHLLVCHQRCMCVYACVPACSCCLVGLTMVCKTESLTDRQISR